MHVDIKGLACLISYLDDETKWVCSTTSLMPLFYGGWQSESRSRRTTECLVVHIHHEQTVKLNTRTSRLLASVAIYE
jgi:hypothetical protein